MTAAQRNPSDVKVSVCMITYNHERFIAQAIESVLMQQTDFPVELVIGEDCSTDGTRNSVRIYGERHPEQIRLLLREHNMGVVPNLVATLGACRGQYVAFLEGDDYWTDPSKLQKQVDFLEAHPKCALSFHNVMVFYEDGTEEPHPRNPPDQKSTLSLKDILTTNPIAPCSVVFRNGLVGEIPQSFYTLRMGDWPLWVLLARHGTLGYIQDVMASYRVHSGGVYSSKNPIEWLPGRLRAYDVIDEELDFEWHSLIERAKIGWTENAADEFLISAVNGMRPSEAEYTFSRYLDQYPEGDFGPMDRWLGKFYTMYFFHAAKSGDYAAVRRSILGLARYQSSLFRNRGVWSICGQALLGQRLAAGFRRVARRIGV